MTTDPVDAERRRTVVLAGHAGDLAIVLAHLDDPSAPVRTAALGAFARIAGDPLDERHADYVAVLTRGITDPDPGVRRRAVELAGATTAPPLRTALLDPDPSVVEMAAWALGERPIDSVDAEERATLVALCTGHADALVREAAAASIGALELPEGRAGVLAAMGDVAAVRRRAVLALAPFEGEDIRAALDNAATDRDWQVRQAAEDLLAFED
ncbi:MAG: hypothetical protein FJW83_01275 [Actinobacteria bacterium]|nr:hypothetical protein [Actinomycetota bacterium]